MIPKPDFAAHRARLLARLAPDEAVLVFANPVRQRSRDTDFRYRQSSDLWWLTGWPHPEAAIFLRPGETPLTMFVQPRDPVAEVWVGRRPGPEGAIARYGADEAFSIEELEPQLTRLIQGVTTLHYAFGERFEHDQLLHRCINKAARAARRNGLEVPETFHTPSKLLHELRLIKTPDELATLREAARITCEAHIAGMCAGVPGAGEHEVEAAIEHIFRREGGSGPGYTNICAAGDNACILHYIENDDTIEPGELVLVDAGCELHGYTADVTRTWPASGRFSEPQRRVYAHVLAAQRAAFAQCKPGAAFLDVHDAAVHRLTEAMLDLGLLDGEVDALIKDETYKRYYMHGTSHWLGLDVHDVGAYARDGGSRVLTPGMVLTVEPGLYIPPDDPNAPPDLRGIGVRIEDDVLITDDGHEILTEAVPKDIEALEALCRREPESP